MMKNTDTYQPGRGFIAFFILASSLLSSCTSMINNAANDMAEDLSAAMLNHDDLDTVKDASPAYLLMSDGLIESNPDYIPFLLANAKLYSAYASVFVTDPERQKRLTRRGLSRALHAACLQLEAACEIQTIDYQHFQLIIKGLEKKDVPVFFILGSSWASWIQANSRDWNAIAQLPRITAIMQRIIELDETYEHGYAHLYLAITASVLPPSLGGKPEVAKRHFLLAIQLSGGHNLIAKVLYAKRYARMMFNRQLHDRLLKEVLAADPNYPDLTLMNMMAKKQARELLASADEYF